MSNIRGAPGLGGQGDSGLDEKVKNLEGVIEYLVEG